jgi:hypothetical protein
VAWGRAGTLLCCGRPNDHLSPGTRVGERISCAFFPAAVSFAAPLQCRVLRRYSQRSAIPGEHQNLQGAKCATDDRHELAGADSKRVQKRTPKELSAGGRDQAKVRLCSWSDISTLDASPSKYALCPSPKYGAESRFLTPAYRTLRLHVTSTTEFVGDLVGDFSALSTVQSTVSDASLPWLRSHTKNQTPHVSDLGQGRLQWKNWGRRAI